MVPAFHFREGIALYAGIPVPCCPDDLERLFRFIVLE